MTANAIRSTTATTTTTATPVTHTFAPAAADLRGLNLVVGLGVTGRSALRLLTALGCDVAAVDSRPAARLPELAALRQEFPRLDCRVGADAFDAATLRRAARLIVSPGVPLQTPALREAAAAGVPLWGDIELFARLARAPVAAITGSNGKSTVTELLGQMAACAGRRVAVGGNLGTPALALLPENHRAGARPEPELYVLELSSFQLEATRSLRPAAAALLNLSPDHLDRHASYADYAAAKRRIFRGCRHAVINADDPHVVAELAAARDDLDGAAVTSYFSVEPRHPRALFCRADDATGSYLARRDGGHLRPLLAVGQLGPGLAGEHNQANALAALALGDALRLDTDAMLTALRGYRGLPHRCERVAERGGVVWVNDSKATNVGATCAALRGLPGPLILIAGGDGKAQDFRPLAAALADAKVKALILIGRDAGDILAVAPRRLPRRLAATMEQAVAQAARLARPGDTVLLSPACASFDMFDDYQQRGRYFAAAARQVGAP